MTSDEFENIKALQSGTLEAVGGRCCVFQPFDRGAHDKRFDDTLVPAIKAAGLEPYRVDRDDGVVIPVETLHEQIRSATLCLADISNQNPNVMYELGYAIAAGRDVVIICSTTNAERLPFDIRHRGIIWYTLESARDFDKLRDDITKKIKALLEKPRTDNSQTRPKLAIIWRPGQPTYHQSFNLEPDLHFILFRIRIQNESPDLLIRGVYVNMEDLEPHSLSCVPTRMRIMNDNDDPHQKQFDLPPEGHRFIDIIQHRPESNWPFNIWHITRGIPLNVPAQPYHFAIRAYAENAPAVSQCFEVYNDRRLGWNMRTVEPPNAKR